MHFASPNALHKYYVFFQGLVNFCLFWVAVENVPNGTFLDGLRPVRAYPPFNMRAAISSRRSPAHLQVPA